jgi:hypothetical protein
VAPSVPDTGGFAVGGGGGTLGGRVLDFGPDIDDTTRARFGVDGDYEVGFGSGQGRHMSALSKLKKWEEWADGTNGMKQYIMRRLPVVEHALQGDINCVLAGSASHPIKHAALACSVNFINAFI